MAKYHIAKATCHYQGNPYQGPSNDNERAECNTLDEARALRLKLIQRNPVGWKIYNAETKQEMPGFKHRIKPQ